VLCVWPEATLTGQTTLLLALLLLRLTPAPLLLRTTA
jgi:hypothetical protein